MRRGVLLLSLLVFLLAFAHVFSAPSTPTWWIVDRDFATIAISLDFQAAESGWIVGGSSSLLPLTLHTNDGGQTLQDSGIENVTEGALMSVRFAPDGLNGVAGSLGFFGLICGAYTNNGMNWTKTHEGKDLICASQGASVPDSNTFILVGQWTSAKQPQGDGVQISLDAGQTWTGYDWNMGTESRYAYFLSADLGYVSGGQWPEENQTDPFSIPKRISKHLVFTGNGVQYLPSKTKVAPTNPNDYQGVIAKATNGASTWEVLVNLTNAGLYFNQISCIDQNNCWAACEGNNITNGAVAAWIYATTNGWQTWSTQLYSEGASITSIMMLNSTFGWAAGAILPESAMSSSLEGTFWMTMDGSTWAPMGGSIKNFYPQDISVVDDMNAYAAGITDVGLSSLARYSIKSN